MTDDKAYPNAVYGCGHLSPIGWCGECAMKMNSVYGKETPMNVSDHIKKLEASSAYGKLGNPRCDGDHALPRCSVRQGQCWHDEPPTAPKDVWREDVSGELGQAFDEVLDELDKATVEYPPMVSAHEGYAVILEELDELWKLVKRKQRDHDRLKPQMRHEACQVAAMAVRFMLDVCKDDSTEKADEYTETEET